MKIFIISLFFLSSITAFLHADDLIVGQETAMIRGDQPFAGKDIAVGDFNGDGKDDAVISTKNGWFIIYGKKDLKNENDIDGLMYLEFPGMTSEDDPKDMLELRVADINKDKIDDLCVGLTSENYIGVLYGKKNGWDQVMNATHFNVVLKNPQQSGSDLFAQNFEIEDFFGSGSLGVAVYAPTSEVSSQVLVFKDILQSGNAFLQISSNTLEALGYLMISGDFIGDSNKDLVVRDLTNIYIYDTKTLNGKVDAQTASVVTIKVGEENFVLSMDAMKMQANPNSKDMLVFGVPNQSKVYGFIGKSDWAGDVVLSQANLIISGGDNVSLLGYDLVSDDIDQDGFLDLSISALSSASDNINTVASGIVYLLGHETVVPMGNNLNVVLNSSNTLASFDGSTFNFWGSPHEYGDFDGDEIKDVLGGGISAYAAVSTGLNPYPIIDIQGSILSGRAPFSANLSANLNFGAIQWTRDGKPVENETSKNLLITLPRGEYSVTAQATRNGFTSVASAVTLIATNNEPTVFIKPSEFTVNTGDTVFVSAGYSDADGDNLIKGFKFVNDKLELEPDEIYPYVTHTRGKDIFSATAEDQEDSSSTSINVTVLNNPPIAKLDFFTSGGNQGITEFLEGETIEVLISVFDYENDPISVDLRNDDKSVSVVAQSANTYKAQLSNFKTGLHTFLLTTSDTFAKETLKKNIMVYSKVKAYDPPSGNLMLLDLFGKPGHDVRFIFSGNSTVDMNPSLSIFPSPTYTTSTNHLKQGTVKIDPKDRGVKTILATCSDSKGSTLNILRQVRIISHPPYAHVSFKDNPTVVGGASVVKLTMLDNDSAGTVFSVTGKVDSKNIVFESEDGVNFEGKFYPTSSGNFEMVLTNSDSVDTSSGVALMNVATLNSVPDVSLFTNNPVEMGTNINVSIIATDSDSTNLTISATLDNSPISLTGSGKIRSALLSGIGLGNHFLAVVVSDGTDEKVVGTTISVMPTGVMAQIPPLPILSIEPKSVFLGSSALISFLVTDDTTMKANSLKVGGIEQDIKGKNSLNTTFTSPGRVLVEYEVSDGSNTVKVSESIRVLAPLNQAPTGTIALSSDAFVGANTVTGIIATSDAENDAVTVSASYAGNSISLTSTGNTHTFSVEVPNVTVSALTSIDVTLSDGTNSSRIRRQILSYPVPAFNAAPVVSAKLDDFAVVSGKTITLSNILVSEANDLTSIYLSRKNFTEDLGKKELDGSVNKTIKMEGKGNYPLILTAYDKDGYTALSMPMKVYNNLPPQDISLSDQSITVTETMKASISISDPNFDEVACNLKVQALNLSNATSGNVGVSQLTIGSNNVLSANVVAVMNDGEVTVEASRSFEITPIYKNFVPIVTITLSDLTIEQGKSATFTVSVTDSDHTEHSIISKLNEARVQMSIAAPGVFKYSYTNAVVGKHTLDVSISDGIDTVNGSITLTVIPTNNPPVLSMKTSVEKEIRMGSPLYITLNGSDADSKDFLEYKLFIDGIEGALSGTNPNERSYIFTPTKTGNVTVLATVFDGQDTAKVTKTIEVVENLKPSVKLSINPTIVRASVPFTITLEISDPNEGETLRGEILINGVSLKLETTSLLVVDHTVNAVGAYNIVGVGSDGDKSSSESIVVEVLPILMDDGTAAKIGADLPPNVLALLDNMGSSTTVEQGNEIIARMTSALKGQDLTGAFRAMSSMVLSGNAESKTISDPSKGVYVDIVSVMNSNQTVKTTSQESSFAAALDSVPLGNKIVFGTIPLNLDPNTPVNAVGKLMSMDMYSGATQVEDGFSIKLTVEKVYNPNKDQFLFYQNPKTGKFENSLVTPNKVGNDLQFNLRHFSVYVIVEQNKPASTSLSSGPFGGTGPEASSGGGCLFK